MPLPTSYTEQSLSEYMLACLGVVGQVLEYTSGSLEEAVNDALIAYGASDIAQATDIKKLRGLAKVAAWQKANDDLVAYYDFSADGGKFDRSQMQTMAAKSLEKAQADAIAFDPNYQVRIVRQRPVNDPYRHVPEEERTL